MALPVGLVSIAYARETNLPDEAAKFIGRQDRIQQGCECSFCGQKQGTAHLFEPRQTLSGSGFHVDRQGGGPG